MSAFVARLEVEAPAGGRHCFLPGVRRGAGHENTGSDFASDGEKLTWRQAAEIIGISDRQMRRWNRATKNLATTGCSTAY